jgi:hypothetical protein
VVCCRSIIVNIPVEGDNKNDDYDDDDNNGDDDSF